MASEQFSLSWDDFHKNMRSGMNSLLESEDLVDVTLAVEGKYLKAHKMVLSVCSPYFRELFKVTPCNHPIVILKDVSYVAMSDLLQFMYQGEVQVSQENLTTFIKTGEALQIKGLTGDGNGTAEECDTQEEFTKPPEEPKVVHSRTKKVASSPALQPPTAKRQRVIPESTPCSSQTPSNTEPVPQSIQQSPLTDIVQFKMEPFDQTQNSSINHEGHDDNFGDDTLDETNVDDNEDYTMMEAGDEEPQAGPSADGATGEGQGSAIVTTTAKGAKCLLYGGYQYRIKRINKTTKTWNCVKRRTLSCGAYVVTDKDNKFTFKNSLHNHSGTFGIYEFIRSGDNKLLVVQEQVYKFQEKVDDIIEWKCYKIACSAKCFTKNYKVVTRMGCHVHDPPVRYLREKRQANQSFFEMMSKIF